MDANLCEQSDQDFGQYLGALDFRFEIDTYIEVCEKTDVSDGNPQKYIAWIHHIHSGDDGCTTEVPHLLVTKYTHIASHPLFQTLGASPTEQTGRYDEREVLLHYSSAARMGQEDDSDIVIIDDIATVRCCDFDTVRYTESPPGTGKNQSSQCKFALKNTLTDLYRCWKRTRSVLPFCLS